MTGKGAASIKNDSVADFLSAGGVGLGDSVVDVLIRHYATWHTAIFAHLVWIVPIVTLVIAIQVYGFDPSVEEAAYDLGASRVQVFKEITLPILWPGIFSGALFAFLLSWGNFPLSTYTTGADQTAPEWLYAKMVAGYTPQVPALGSLTVLMAAIILFGSYWLGMHFKKKNNEQRREVAVRIYV